MAIEIYSAREVKRLRAASRAAAATLAHVGERLRPGVSTADIDRWCASLGAPSVRQLDDGWTVVTADGSLSAQLEHTIVVTSDGCEVLTLV